jgi:hypothetical protein
MGQIHVLILAPIIEPFFLYMILYNILAHRWYLSIAQTPSTLQVQTLAKAHLYSDVSSYQSSYVVAAFGFFVPYFDRLVTLFPTPP